MIDKPEKSGVKQEIRDKKGRFIKGMSGNPFGKPIGTKSFSTDFDEVVEKIANDKKITKSEARKILLEVGFAQAKDGNYNFWKEIIDRYYGKVADNLNLTIGKKIAGYDLDKILDYVKNDEDNGLSEDNKDVQEDTDLSGGDISE